MEAENFTKKKSKTLQYPILAVLLTKHEYCYVKLKPIGVTGVDDVILHDVFNHHLKYMVSLLGL